MHKKDLLSPWHHWSQREKVFVGLFVIALLFAMNTCWHYVYQRASTPPEDARASLFGNGTKRVERTDITVPEGKVGVSLGDAVIVADLALTEAEQTQGLSGRESLAPNEGMLFLFEKPARYSFWMKDMLFPLDIIWLDEGGRVVFIKKNMPPSTDPEVLTPTNAALYVLEVPAGTADINHIDIGSHMTVFE